jgi:hypothetical protein
MPRRIALRVNVGRREVNRRRLILTNLINFVGVLVGLLIYSVLAVALGWFVEWLVYRP